MSIDAVLCFLSHSFRASELRDLIMPHRCSLTPGNLSPPIPFQAAATSSAAPHHSEKRQQHPHHSPDGKAGHDSRPCSGPLERRGQRAKNDEHNGHAVGFTHSTFLGERPPYAHTVRIGYSIQRAPDEGRQNNEGNKHRRQRRGAASHLTGASNSSHISDSRR